MKILDTPSAEQPEMLELLEKENEELRRRLEEEEETILAIRSGAVDALVVEEAAGHRIYTLEGADRPYRLFVEEMQQGAATLHADGAIAWCNRQLAELLQVSQERLLGESLHDFVSPESRAHYDLLLRQGQTRSGRGEAQLLRADGGRVPVFLTFNALPADCGAAIGALVTDVTTQRHHEQLKAAHTALRASEERVRKELAATTRLQEISSRLIQEGDPGQLYLEILDAAMGIMQSDMASIQVVDEGRDALRLLAWRGFDAGFGETFPWVGRETQTSCSMAMRTLRRVVVTDVETCEFIAGSSALADHRKTGIRAVQSTPLFSRGGRMLGMISTHWRQPHPPAEGDLRLLDVLARQAADLMERKLAEQALRERERRFREMIDALPAAIYTTDASGRLTHFNPAAVEFSGRIPELGNDHWCVSFKLFHPDGTPMPHDECPMAVTLKEGRAVRGAEAIAERPDGTRVWFTPYPTPLRDDGGEIVGGINMLVDITERKQAEEQLRQSESRARELYTAAEAARVHAEAAKLSAEAATRAKDDFLAALSHELRTPLSPALLLATALTDDPALPPHVRGDADAIARGIALQVQLVDDLLDLTRITGGKLRLDLQPIDAHGALREALEMVRSEVRERRIDVTLALGAAHRCIHADPVRMQQVFWNVLKNAVKFTPHGGAITVRTLHPEEKPHTLVVEVTDTGVGIAPEMLEKIFDSFAQEHHDGAHRFGGLGLGLAITRRLVELQHGRIHARSDGRGRGATFRIEMPAAVAESGRAEADTPPVPPSTRPPGRRILLVEDHKMTRLTLARLLERRGHIVRVAETAGQALELAVGTECDLVISDIGLPDCDGHTFMARLRDEHRMPGIALSGYGGEDDLRRSRESGFFAHLTKPVNIRDLEAAISTAPPAPAPRLRQPWGARKT